MRKVVLFSLLAGTAVFMILAEPKSAPLGSTTVVVELFTSQGCSSCPPADDLLRRIAHDASLKGKVIPLAFHVDYWNHLGWRDPFSSKEWSARQMAYVRAMKLSSAYTPQAVINGDTQIVGSNSGAIYDAIRAASSKPLQATVRATMSGDEVVIDAESEVPNLEALVVVVEKSITTRIKRGENEGRTLVNERIVRELVRAGRLRSTPIRARVTPMKNGEMIVLLQDPATLRIYAATAIK